MDMNRRMRPGGFRVRIRASVEKRFPGCSTGAFCVALVAAWKSMAETTLEKMRVHAIQDTPFCANVGGLEVTTTSQAEAEHACAFLQAELPSWCVATLSPFPWSVLVRLDKTRAAKHVARWASSRRPPL